MFRPPGEPEFWFKGSWMHALPRVILALRAKCLLWKGCQRYLSHVVDTRKEVLKLDDIPVVREFPDVFPEDLPGIPIDREIEFSIDLLLELLLYRKHHIGWHPLNLRNSSNSYKSSLIKDSLDQVHLLGVHQFYL